MSSRTKSFCTWPHALDRHRAGRLRQGGSRCRRAALDPVKRLGGQLLEWAGRRDLAAQQARTRLDARLRGTGLSFDDVARRYAHQLSGGMQQRVINAGSLVSTRIS